MINIRAICPKCTKPFSASVRAPKDRIVLTPCCGWVGKGDVPPWAKAAHERALAA